MARKKGNNYIIDEENKIVKIELRRRKKENLWTIIDLDDFDRVVKTLVIHGFQIIIRSGIYFMLKPVFI